MGFGYELLADALAQVCGGRVFGLMGDGNMTTLAHLIDITDPLQSLAIYTSLFNKLGFVGVGCTAIAIAMLPLMKKLSLNHALANVPPVPPVHNEDL